MKQEDLAQYERVRATYRPLVTDDLRHGAEKLIGRRFVWDSNWIVEDGRYEGQLAMTIAWDQGHKPVGWVPFCDLADVERVPDEEWLHGTLRGEKG